MNNPIPLLLLSFFCTTLLGQTLDATFTVRMTTDTLSCPIDASNAPALKFPPTVFDMGLQSDGKIYVRGSFSTLNGIALNDFARIQMDGAVDTAFEYYLDTCKNVDFIAIQPDGKIITKISNYYNYPTFSIHQRISANGSVDTNFLKALPIEARQQYGNKFIFLPDGKVAVYGYSFYILNEDGSIFLDRSAFLPERNFSSFRTVLPQPDGKMLLGGGRILYENRINYPLLRINADYTLDDSFPLIQLNQANQEGVIGSINDLEVLADGTIVVVGDFSFFNGQPVSSGILFLNPDGTLKLLPNLNKGFRSNGGRGKLTEVSLLDNGLLVVSGFADTYNGIPIKNFVILDQQANLVATGADSLEGAIRKVITDADNNYIYLGGDFNEKGDTTPLQLVRIDAGENYFSDSIRLNLFPKEACLNNPNNCQTLQTFAAQLETLTTCGATQFDWSIRSNNVLLAEGQGSSFDYTVDMEMTYEVEFSARDTCGAEATISKNYTFLDCQAPILEAANGKPFSLNQSKEIAVYPADFILAASDNCSPEEDLIFKISFEEASDISKETLLQLPDSISFSCDRLGTTEAYIYVLDAAGNVTSKTVYIVLSLGIGNDGCGIFPTFHQVSGIVKNTLGMGIENTNIHFKGQKEATEITLKDGSYTHVLPEGSYDIIPSKEDDPINGISTFDLVLIQKHLLNRQLFTNKYQYLAADINLSGTVTAFDLVLLSKLILGREIPFTAQESWIFLPADYIFPEAYTTDFLVSQTIQTSLEIDSGFNFIGVKRGDVNGSAKVNSNLHLASSRNNKTLPLRTKDIWLEPNKRYTVPFIFSNTDALSGFQLALSTEDLSLLAINDEPIVESVFNSKENLTWYAPTPQELRLNGIATTALPVAQFALTVQAKRAGYLSELLYLNQHFFNNEAYTDQLITKDILLSYDRSSIAINTAIPLLSTTALLEQNPKIYPNPSTDFVTVEFNQFSLNPNSNTEILLMDISGKILLRELLDEHSLSAVIDIKEYFSGTYFIKVNRDGLPSFVQKIIKL